MKNTAFVSGLGPWFSVVILFVSAFSAMAILARYSRHTDVQRGTLLALPVAAAGAVLALLVILVPYLIASPPIDDRALAATIGTGRWLWPAALAAANKRIGNILKKADIEIPGMEDPALLSEPAELALAEAVEAAYDDTGHALSQGDYVDVLAHLARLRPQVDAFFDAVMVNADDPKVRANRLALLKRLADRLGSVAAIEHLSV